MDALSFQQHAHNINKAKDLRELTFVIQAIAFQPIDAERMALEEAISKKRATFLNG